MGKTLNFIHYCLLNLLFISLKAQPSLPIFSSQYFMNSSSRSKMIPINQSQFTVRNNGSWQLLRVNVKIQVLSTNGNYVDSALKTGNILVKYWKNQDNTPAQSVLSYSYVKINYKKQQISSRKKFKYTKDDNDQGLVDMEALHNYQNQHNFIHTIGNELSDILLVIGIYRFQDYNLTDIIGMTTLQDSIKISIFVYKALPLELKCPFCFVKSFCPLNQCKCYQQTYSDCSVEKKTIKIKFDLKTVNKDNTTLKPGTISFIQIQPDNASSSTQSFTAELLISFSGLDPTLLIQSESILLLIYVQSKSDPSYMIPSIYNYDILDSPSFAASVFTNSVTSQQKLLLSNFRNISSFNSLQLYQRLAINKNQTLTAAFYYKLKDQQFNQYSDLNVVTQMTFALRNPANSESSVNLGFVIGMVAFGFILLLIIICLLHFMIAKRFDLFKIFINSQTSNRTSLSGGGSALARVANVYISDIPEISFDFIKQLIFKPLRYMTQFKLEQNNLSRQINELMLPQICSICLQEFKPQNKIKYTYCGHIIDSNCLQSWFEKQLSCPMCRQLLEPEDIIEYKKIIIDDIFGNRQNEMAIDEEVNIIKKLFKEWKTSKHANTLIGAKITEENFADHQQSDPTIDIQTIPNISTMLELEKTTKSLDRKNFKKSSNFKQSSKFQSQMKLSLKTINFHSISCLAAIFSHNSHVSEKRFAKIYRFYRCIYLYHQKNKNFKEKQKFPEPLLNFEEKLLNSKDENINPSQSKQNSQIFTPTNKIDLIANLSSITTRKYTIKTAEDKIKAAEDKIQTAEEEENSNTIMKIESEEEQYTRNNFNIQHKLVHTEPIKLISKKNYLDLQLIPNQQLGLQSIDFTQILKTQISPVVVHNIKPDSIFQQTSKSNIFKSNLSPIHKKKHISMREQMEYLAKQLQKKQEEKFEQQKPQKYRQSTEKQKKSEELNQQCRFRYNSITFSQDEDQNIRYQIPIEDLLPVSVEKSFQSRQITQAQCQDSIQNKDQSSDKFNKRISKSSQRLQNALLPNEMCPT